MRRIIAVVLILLFIGAVVGIFVSAVYQARQQEEFLRCQNNLRQIGGFALFHAALPGQPIPERANVYIPTGTVVNPVLAPDQRMSWYLLTLSALEQGAPEAGPGKKKSPQITEILKEIDVLKAWDAEVNLRVARTRLVVFLCPAQNPTPGDDRPQLTNYFGNGGIGHETPALTMEQAGKKAGPWRYDSPTPLETIQAGDGLSNTIMLVESTFDLGPWLRGGPSTIRSLDPDEPPYLGPARLYSGCHLGRGNFSMADGSVRVFTDRVDPAVFRAFLTMNGDEKAEEFDNDK